MRLRVVDYAANPGGGLRFAVELLRGLASIPDVAFEVVSSGDALARYRTLLAGAVPADFVDLPPSGTRRHRTLLAGVPGAGPLNRMLGRPDLAFGVPEAALGGCDVAWFPWGHRHRLPPRLAVPVVASLHDTIMLDFPDGFAPTWVRSEWKTTRGWVGSAARIVVGSNATAGALRRLLGVAPGRVSVIPLTGRHRFPEVAPPARPGPFTGREYLLCPANHSHHKNHEVLFPAAAGVAPRHPLVLTGEGTDFHVHPSPRSAQLRRLSEAAGLVPGETVFPVGYVTDADYYRILDGAWALVMPTLAEGGGSFPVWEALERGIPAVVSDIPVLREMMERAGGEVLWFDPADPADLARALAELEAGYERYRDRAVAQRDRLVRRTWRDVAAEYAALLGLPAPAGTETEGRT